MEENNSANPSRKRGVDALVSFSRKDSGGSRGSGNNSDNSATCSIGNNSFGFNFDAEEGMIPSSEEQQQNSEAADAAVASLASIASETRGELFTIGKVS